MQNTIEVIRQPRQYLLTLVQNLSPEELNYIPTGFNNNIIWNIAHLVAAQQGICYLRGGHPFRISDRFFETYKSGTKPEKPVTLEELAEVKELLMSTLDQLEADSASGLFSSYTPWVTRYGVNITSVEDAIQFLPFHEGLHVGYIMALKRVIG